MNNAQLELANTYNGNAVKIWDEGGSFEEAEALYREALSIVTTLMEKAKTDKCIDTYGMVCHNLGNLLRETKRKGEARHFYEEAVRVYQELAGESTENFHIYGERLAGSMSVMSSVLSWNDEINNVEWFEKEALRIRRLLADKEPERYEGNVARSCAYCALVMDEMKNYEKAENLFREAISIEEKLVKTDFDNHGGFLAADCYNMANVLKAGGKLEEAVRLYLNASKIWQELKARSPEKYTHIAVKDVSYEEAVKITREIEETKNLKIENCIKNN